MQLMHSDVSDKVLQAYYEVYNTMGYGFLEKVYENALCIELTRRGIKSMVQQQLDVYYKGEKVGEYFADLVVEDRVIVELKAAKVIAEEHEYQLINYLKATNIEVGLLLNFGKKPEFKRKVFSNQ